ncbi:MAG: hypothetical protein QME81_12850 [bacterium]|nr:hypothetical protein [bacterium]
MEQICEVNTQKIGEKGREIFHRISPQLEKGYRGKFVVIDVDSEDYFIGDTSLEADKKARQKYPKKVFFMGKVGYKAAVSFKGKA